jgi:hypothetical protein
MAPARQSILKIALEYPREARRAWTRLLNSRLENPRNEAQVVPIRAVFIRALSTELIDTTPK